MNTLKDCIDRVLTKATHSRPYLFPENTLVDAKLRVTGKTITVTNLGPLNIPPFDVAIGGVRANMPQLYAVAGMISSIGFAATQYGNSADHVIFRTLYNVAERDLVYYQGGNQGTKRVLSAPCMICGLVLPLANLTIDHQRPQSGGELEAVAKVFRTFGLTKEGPKGPKGLLIQAHLRSVNPSLATFGSVAPQPGRAAAAGTSLSERYTLNDQGALLLSFVLAAGEIQKLKTSCMNSIVNLRPACGVCNSSRGNPLKFSP